MTTIPGLSLTGLKCDAFRMMFQSFHFAVSAVSLSVLCCLTQCFLEACGVSWHVISYPHTISFCLSYVCHSLSALCSVRISVAV